MMLWINAPHYCAGAIFENGRCVHAAPIIRWMIGKSYEYVVHYINKKGFEWKEVTNC